jgi:DNA-directed RNA polymerase subunit M
MEFCPKCGTVMFPKGDCFECKNCEYTTKLTKESVKKYEISEKISDNENIIVTTDEIQTLPTTTVKCPKCDNKEASWWLIQTRGADESETRFFRCTKCSCTWREYD